MSKEIVMGLLKRNFSVANYLSNEELQEVKKEIPKVLWYYLQNKEILKVDFADLIIMLEKMLNEDERRQLRNFQKYIRTKEEILGFIVNLLLRDY